MKILSITVFYCGAGRWESVSLFGFDAVRLLNTLSEYPNKKLYLRNMKLQLPSILFWDIDPSKLDYDAKARYVIGRVVMYGDLADWQAILAYYGSERVRDEMLQERYLDNKSLNYLSFYFELPKTAFRCYTLQQSTPQHWNY